MKMVIPIIVRMDPIIPFINDDEVTRIADRLSFVNHITTSTRFKKIFPIEAGKLEKLYFKEEEKISNSWYLPQCTRYEIELERKQRNMVYLLVVAEKTVIIILVVMVLVLYHRNHIYI